MRVIKLRVTGKGGTGRQYTTFEDVYTGEQFQIEGLQALNWQMDRTGGGLTLRTCQYEINVEGYTPLKPRSNDEK